MKSEGGQRYNARQDERRQDKTRQGTKTANRQDKHETKKQKNTQN